MPAGCSPEVQTPAKPQLLNTSPGAKEGLHPPVPGNMRIFLDKLGRRRKRIPCTAACKRALAAALMELREDPRDSSVLRTSLHELLRVPPPKVPGAVLRDLMEVSSAYDAAGDGYIDTEELLEHALEVQPTLLKRLWPALLSGFIVVWLVLAPLVLCFGDDWKVNDAFYFAFMSFSTVGVHARGLFSISTAWVKAFAAIYTLLGFLLLATALTCALGTLLSRYDEHVRQLLSARSVEDILASDGFGPGGSGPPLETLLQAPASKSMASHPLEWALSPPCAVREKTRTAMFHSLRRLAFGSVVVIVVMAIGTLIFKLSADESTWTDALLWSVSTSTTVGHDGHAEHLPPVGWSICYVLLVGPIMFVMILEAARAHLHVRHENLKAELASRVLPRDVLIGLDADGCGVTKVEFLCAILLAKNKVTALDLWQALLQFQDLDRDGNGILTSGELAGLRRDRVQWGKAKAIYAMEQAKSRSCCARTKHEEDVEFAGATDVVFADDLSKAPHLFVESGKTTDQIQGDVTTFIQPQGLSALQMAYSPQMPSSVRLATSVSTVFDGLGEHTRRSPPRSKKNASMRSTRSELLQFYDENLKVRHQLHERAEELLHAMQSKERVEQDLRQALAERQSLHGDIRLAQHKVAELQERLTTVALEKGAAEKARQEAEQRADAATRAAAQAEQRAADAELKVRSAEQLVAKSEEGRLQAEAATKEAEGRAEEVARHMKEFEKETDRKSYERMKELELRCAELEAKRQGEIKQGLLELQSIAAGQQALHKELQRSQQTLHVPASSASSSLLRTGLQPWEAWEAACARNRAAVSFPPPDLLTERVRDQALKLEYAIKDLRSRQEPSRLFSEGP